MTVRGDVCPECGRPRHELVYETVEPTGKEATSSRTVAYAALLLVPLLVLTAFLLPGGDAPDADPDEVEGVAPPPVGIDEQTIEEQGPVPATEVTSGFRLAFANADGTVIVDLASGKSERSDIALSSPEVAYDAPFVLVTDEKRTLAVHPSFPADAFALATNYRLVPTDAAGEYVFRPVGDAATDVFIGQSADGSFGRRLEIPPGTRQLAVPGLGLLVIAPGGATFRASFAGFEPFSSVPVIAATPTHRLELRCDGGLECATVLVENETGGETEIPAEIASSWGGPVLSPDGGWIVATYPDGIVRHDVATWTPTMLFEGPSVSEPAWAPDSSFVVVVEGPATAPRAQLFFVDGRPPEVVVIDDIGVVGPVESNLVVVP